MEIEQLKLIYFSATQTTQSVLESIARGIAIENVGHINMTAPERAQKAIPLFSNELALIGAPVYGGRLPVDAIKRFKRLKANRTLAVFIVVYGNRDFEDALLELKNLAVEVGFIPIAGGAFIGEHSFATKEVPIANGRPDDLDVKKAAAFGEKIRAKVKLLQSPEAQKDFEVPGKFPFEAEGARPMVVSPVTKTDTCTVCGTCAGVCPTAAISLNGSVATEIELCIRCCACIKNCPTGARVVEDPMWKNIGIWLNQNCGVRKEPQIFGLDG